MSTNIPQYSGCCTDMGLAKNNHGPHGRSQLPVQEWVMCAHEWHMNGCCADMGLDKNNHGPHGRGSLAVKEWDDVCT